MKPVRRFYTSGSYFFTVVTHNRQKILCSNFAIKILKKAFQHVMKEHPFDIEAIVVLPDHLHCILQLPDDDSNFSVRWMLIKNFFSKQMPGKVNHRREKEIWQKRYWDHYIRSEHDWQTHADYIHYNPVKHGYALSPKDWKYSSFHKFVEMGVYEIDWGCNDEFIKNLEYE